MFFFAITDSIQAASTTATTTTVQVQTESTGVHAELPDAASSVPPSTCESLSVVEAFEKSNSEVVRLKELGNK